MGQAEQVELRVFTRNNVISEANVCVVNTTDLKFTADKLLGNRYSVNGGYSVYRRADQRSNEWQIQRLKK